MSDNGNLRRYDCSTTACLLHLSNKEQRPRAQEITSHDRVRFNIPFSFPLSDLIGDRQKMMMNDTERHAPDPDSLSPPARPRSTKLETEEMCGGGGGVRCE